MSSIAGIVGAIWVTVVGVAETGAVTGKDILENSPTRDLLSEGASNPAAVDGVLTPEEVAQSVVEGVIEEKFHILPHPEVSEYSRRKSDDIDRWLAGMHRFQQKLFPAGESPSDWLIS